MVSEEVVKVNVPFTGTYRGRIADTKKGRFIVPASLRKIYQLRQDKESVQDCIAFIAPGKYPIIATMTDNPPEGEYQDYSLVLFDDQGRVNVPFPIDSGSVNFFGHGDYIEVSADRERKSLDYMLNLKDPQENK